MCVGVFSVWVMGEYECSRLSNRVLASCVASTEEVWIKVVPCIPVNDGGCPVG